MPNPSRPAEVEAAMEQLIADANCHGHFPQAETLLAYIETLEAANGWRPIGEAPRDGTGVLLFSPRDGVGCGHYYETERIEWEDVDADTKKVKVRHRDGYWNATAADSSVELWQPTHFKPLPTPPSTPATSKGE